MRARSKPVYSSDSLMEGRMLKDWLLDQRDWIKDNRWRLDGSRVLYGGMCRGRCGSIRQVPPLAVRA